MTTPTTAAAGRTSPVTRLLEPGDAPAIAALLRANREAFAPWTPAQDEQAYTAEGQAESARISLQNHGLGLVVPLVVLDEQGAVVGTLNLQSIIRGFFQSCSVGYWLDTRAQGRGLATAALREAVRIAFEDLRLHRVQAETLTHNVASRRVLERVGFTAFGVAPSYMPVGGAWQDHVLYQLLTPTPERVVLPGRTGLG